MHLLAVKIKDIGHLFFIAKLIYPKVYKKIQEN
jgi:hypothetical protein